MIIWKEIYLYPMYIISSNGEIKNIKTKRSLSICDDSKWYKLVTLYNKLWRKTHYIHRLLWQSFIPNPDNKTQINHLNGIKSDNRLENLERCTASENQIHSIHSLGTVPWNTWNIWKGGRWVIQYDMWWNIIKEWGCISDIQRELWIYQSNITRCCQWYLKTYKWFIFKYK